MNEYVKLSMKDFGLNPLHYLSLPVYSFDYWLMSSGATLDTLQDKQMLDDFDEAKRGGICGIMGDRYVNSINNSYSSNNSNSNSNRSIWYMDSNNLYGYAMMQNLPYKDFEYYNTSLDIILNTSDDSDQCYCIVCDINYTNSCKNRTEKLALMPNKRKINKNELGHREREKGRARTEKLILDQNKKKTEYMVHYRILKFYIKIWL